MAPTDGTGAVPDSVPPARRGPKRHQIRRLTGSTRWLVIAAIATLALTPFVAAAMALAQGWQPTGDVATIALRGRDVYSSHPPLVGQPTTGDRATGVASNHPGPVEYWLLAVTEPVFGWRAGVVLCAVTVNAAALAGCAWLAFRRGGPVLLALTSVALAGLIHALGAPSVYDALNSELTVYPMVLSLLAAWSVLSRDWQMAPVLAGAATIAAQLHVAGATFVLPLVFTAVIAMILAGRRRPRLVARHRMALVVAGVVLVVGWLPVLIGELRGPSNINALLRTARAPQPRLGWSFTAERLVAAVAPPPLFLRSTGTVGFLTPEVAAGVVLAALLIGGVAVLGALARNRTRSRDASHLGALVLLVTAVSAWFGARQPVYAAFRADGTRWLWVVSLGIWVSLAWSGWRLVDEHRARRLEKIIVPALLAVTAVGLMVPLARGLRSDQRDAPFMSVTDRLAGETIRRLPRGTYHVSFSGVRAAGTVGPGIAYRLEVAGRKVLVDDTPLSRGYGDERVGGTATVDGRLRVVSADSSDLGPQPGERLLADSGDGPRRSDLTVFRVYLQR